MGWKIEPITDEHDCRKFKCGKHHLDHWLISKAIKNEQKRVSRTRVLVDEPDRSVIGFYSLCATNLKLDYLPSDVRAELGLKYDAPAVLLGQLAIHRDHQGHKLGAALLIRSLQTAASASELIGAMAVVVDAIDDNARKFYERHRFVALNRTGGNHLYLPMSAIPPANTADAQKPA